MAPHVACLLLRVKLLPWLGCLTLYRVMAWQIFSVTMLARTLPDLPWSVVLDLDAWQACAIHQCPTPPAEPPSLAQAVH